MNLLVARNTKKTDLAGGEDQNLAQPHVDEPSYPSFTSNQT
jgi:hypothetical protein